MSEEVMIDPNEELDCYVGMSANTVENDLVDKDIQFRTRVDGVPYRDTADFSINRVNLVIDRNDVVLQAYYG